MNHKILNFVKKPTFPLLLLIIVNLTIGLFTFQDYGLSWDEPLFYKYADAIGYAYSLQPRLDGTFNIQNAYGPDEEHAMYGPAYILAGRGFVYLFEKITGLDRGTLWHLVNFTFFQVGLLLFYLLCRRWMSSWAAFAATLLFSTQPLLWGHAFINPKDIPFLIFFMAALYTGLRFVDRIHDPEESVPEIDETEKSRWQIQRQRWIPWTFVFFALIFVLVALNPIIQNTLRSLMQSVYAAAPNSFWGRAFRAVAEDANKVSVDYYAGKLVSLYRWVRIGLLVILLPFFTTAITIWVFPKGSQRFWHRVGVSTRNIVFWDQHTSFGCAIRKAVIPGILLGLVTSIRVLGPMVGMLIALYFLLRNGRRPIREMVIYAIISIITIYLTWPYLWANPIGNLLQVLAHMSNNPQPVGLIFMGQVMSSPNLPWTYLPTLLGITLTEPVWFLFFGGLAIVVYRVIRKRMEWRDLLVTLLWFFIPFIYVVFSRPPMYDGFRHFMFILPPIFVVIGIFFDEMMHWVKQPVFRWLILAAITLPGVIGLITLHPYEYAYYNSYVGGSSGAFRQYENDYWLTCYREAMRPFEKLADQSPTVYVFRQPTLAAAYAAEGVKVLPYKSTDLLKSGDYILLSTRTNIDQTFLQESELRWSFGRQGATYCLVKQVH